jgi:hypothetical protein
MKYLNNFIAFEFEKFFKDKELEFIDVFDAYEKKYNETTKRKEKTDNRLGVWVNLLISDDKTAYEVKNKETEEKEIAKQQNYGEKMLVLVDDPNKTVDDYKKYSIRDKVVLKGFKDAKVSGRFNDVLQLQVKDVVKKNETPQPH